MLRLCAAIAAAAVGCGETKDPHVVLRELHQEQMQLEERIAEVRMLQREAAARDTAPGARLPDAVDPARLAARVRQSAAAAGVAVIELEAGAATDFRGARGQRFSLAVRGRFRRVAELTWRLASAPEVIAIPGLELTERSEVDRMNEIDARLELLALARGGDPSGPELDRDVIDPSLRRPLTDRDLAEDRSGEARRDPMQSFGLRQPGAPPVAPVAPAAGPCAVSPGERERPAREPLGPPVKASDIPEANPLHAEARALATENARMREHLERLEKLGAATASRRALDNVAVSPAWVLVELGTVLTPMTSPTMDQDTTRALQSDPARRFDERWYAKDLYLDRVAIRDCHIAIAGRARRADQIHQLGLRLEASVHFSGVDLTASGETFTARARVAY